MPTHRFADLCEDLRARILDLLPRDERVRCRLVCKDFATTPVNRVCAGNNADSERLVKRIASQRPDKNLRKGQHLRFGHVRHLTVCPTGRVFPELLEAALTSPACRGAIRELAIGSIRADDGYAARLLRAAGNKGLRRLSLGTKLSSCPPAQTLAAYGLVRRPTADYEANDFSCVSAQSQGWKGAAIFDTPGAFDDLEELVGIGIHHANVVELRAPLPNLRLVRTYGCALVVRAGALPPGARICMHGRARVTFVPAEAGPVSRYCMGTLVFTASEMSAW